MKTNLPKIIVATCAMIILVAALLKVFETRFPLKIEITPAESTYSIARHGRAKEQEDDPNAFLVHFRISNPSRTSCAIVVRACGYYYSWGTDNTNVQPQKWRCDLDFPIGKLLDSASDYSGNLPIVVRTNTLPGPIYFRMCFLSGPKKYCRDDWAQTQKNWADGTYWSNEIKINVVP